MSDQASKPAKSGLSLYANLLDPSGSAPGTISSAPVTYSKPEATDDDNKKQAFAASLRFQPTKRPQQSQNAQKAKAKAAAIANKLSSLSKPDISVPVATAASDVKAEDATIEPKSTVADWKATLSEDEDANAYYASTRQRGGRKKRKKNKEQDQIQFDWDDIYDPSRPNNYEEYKHSEEKIREVREWKDLLYRHRYRSRSGSQSDHEQRNHQFAPPPTMSFAPPPIDDVPPPPPPPPDEEEYVPPPAAVVPADPTGEDAFARRMRMSGMQAPQPPPPPPLAGQIARAPVRYSLPTADPSLPTETEAEAMDLDSEPQPEPAAPSSRPGQAKFAERLMAKYGWEKGQGLGKDGTGVTTALYAKADKRKKKSDAEGGGFVTPSQIGRILGGTKSKAAQEAEDGKFGPMSEVVKLEGMLGNIDVQAELRDGTIMQEIGEECGDKYGRVERVYIHGKDVFVHFTSALSALRAVNALEGRVFDGNTITARFWNREKFEDGLYE